LTDEEDRVEENTENEDSDLAGAEKIRFRKHIPWKQIARWSKPGKPAEDVQDLTRFQSFWIWLHNLFSRAFSQINDLWGDCLCSSGS
jgi:hypothetical protein